MQRQDTHSKLIGYLLWIFGFLGSHRFYYGKPVTGTIWFFTLGLFFIGWIIDLFLIPAMDREADLRFTAGDTDYNVSKLYDMLPASTSGDPLTRTPADNQTVRNVFIIGPDKKIKLVLDRKSVV